MYCPVSDTKSTSNPASRNTRNGCSASEMKTPVVSLPLKRLAVADVTLMIARRGRVDGCVIVGSAAVVVARSECNLGR